MDFDPEPEDYDYQVNDYDSTGDESDEYEAIAVKYPVKARDKTKTRRRKQKHKAAPDEFVQMADNTPQSFKPTFTSSRHELAWFIPFLGPFYADYLITDVLRLIKSGKEANVYLCHAHPSTGLDLIAAKVYRPRMLRNLRNDAAYRLGRELVDEEGKEARDRRRHLAVKKRTSYGKEVLHTEWLSNEFATLRRLFEAGADVPRPIASGDNAMLMSYVGDEQAPASTLNRVRLTPSEARELFERLKHNVELMLAHQCIHADLSAYNVLYWRGDIKIIDLPQAVNPLVNPHAFRMLERDLQRLGDYFRPYGLPLDAGEVARSLWRRYVSP